MSVGLSDPKVCGILTSMTMPRGFLLLILALGGCKGDGDNAGGPGAEPSLEPPGRFLDEPSGVPPAALQPEHIELHLRAVTDVDVVRASLSKLTGRAAVWPAQGAADVAALTADRVPAPVLRVRFSGPLQQDELAALIPLGVRGNVVLWYPVLTIRERLQDGRTGVWRGITRLREELPTRGARLGGTPVLFLGAVAALDVTLLEGGAPKGFTALVQQKDWDSPASKALFTAPDGTPVAWLVPKGRSVIEASFDDAVESLVPIVKQGGRAWILIALPLAEQRKPER